MKSQERKLCSPCHVLPRDACHFISATLLLAYQPLLTWARSCHSRRGKRVRSGCNLAHCQVLVTVTSEATRLLSVTMTSSSCCCSFSMSFPLISSISLKYRLAEFFSFRAQD